jgi:ABC-type branched-subunit amino acid transport system substrate-binding protein
VSRCRYLLVLAVCVAVVAAACGRDDDDDGEAASTAAAPTTAAEAAGTTAPAAPTATGAATPTSAAPTTTADPCAGVTLEATEIGVTADTITIHVMADVGSVLAPGLFQGSVDGVKAWADQVNERGGLACRRVEVRETDSRADPTETVNGILDACANSLAMVGTSALFLVNTTDLTSCADRAGHATGIPDLAAVTLAAAETCSPVSFTIQLGGGLCPYSGSGPRDYVGSWGSVKWLVEHHGAPVHGVFLVATDLPSTKETSHAANRSAQLEVGMGVDGEFGFSGRQDQSEFAVYLQAMRTAGSNLAFGQVMNDQAMLKWRLEAAVQGVTADLWYCGPGCYTDGLLLGGEDVEGTYVGIPFLPLEEADTNGNLQRFVDALDSPDVFGADAFAAGLLFEQVVDEIVATDGPNALTRTAVLEHLRAIDSFDAGGWFGPIDIAHQRPSNCSVLLQVQDGKFVRVFPTARGTMYCDLPLTEGPNDFDAIADFGG